MSDPGGKRGSVQLTFEDARARRGPTLAVLPDAARVEERLARLARAQGLAAGPVARRVAPLERELGRGARRARQGPAAPPPPAPGPGLREGGAERSGCGWRRRWRRACACASGCRGRLGGPS